MLMGRLFPPFYNWFPSTTNVKIYTINSLFILYNNNLHVLVFTSTKLCSDCMSLSVTQGGGGDLLRWYKSKQELWAGSCTVEQC